MNKSTSKNSESKNIMSATWKPVTRAEIAGKESLYCTARITVTGECVRLMGHYDGSFQTVRGCYNGRELDSFCL